MPTLPPIANLQAFEAVARRRSFALAAAGRDLTASAISHQVSRLEAQLDIRLFERSAHGVRLSPAGEHYLMHVGSALNAIATATDDLRHGIRNSLYVHSAPSIASLWLMPRLHHFAQAYPEISLNLSAAHTPSDFALGQADIDIRYGIPQWGDLVVEPLFEEAIVPLASPAFIKAHKLKRAEQLLDLPLIQSNVSIVQWSDWFGRFTKLRAPDRFSLRFDRAQMSLDAATQGLGVAAGNHVEQQALVGAHALGAKTLVEVQVQVHLRQRGLRLVLGRALGQQVQLQPVLGLQVDHQAVGRAHRGLEDGVRHGAEVDDDVRVAPREALAGADVERHTRPAPVADLGPQRDKGFGGAAGGHAFFLRVAGHLRAVHVARRVLTANQVLADGLHAPGLERLQHLELFIADGVGAGVDGRLHADGAQQLQRVVLHHVAQGAGLVIERAARFHAQFFGNGDLDVGNG